MARKERQQSIEVYYGTSQTGKRIHFGTEILHPAGKEWRVVAHCGNSIVSHSLDEPMPSRVTEFCKNCFRTAAWDAYERYMLQRGAAIEREAEQEQQRIKRAVANG